jgi:ubiquinol-cytochrome c reductase iron-sulfur subunit
VGKRRPEGEGRHPIAVAAIGWAFLLSFAASVAITAIYAVGGQVQIEGAMLFVILGGISVGLVLWAAYLMPDEQHVEERKLTFDEPEEREEAEEAFVEGAEAIGRRKFLGRLLGAALAGLGVALLFPIRSLGTRPGKSLFHTAWRAGVRAVREDGSPVRAADLVADTVLTVFPEGRTDSGDSQTLLIKTAPGAFRPKAGRETWSPDGIVAFSKICTHAGCPVGLFEASTNQLFCPCHQSVFSVPQWCRPVKGPATQPLPQLPITVDPDGYIVAQGDFPEPVGPEFWNYGRKP